MLGLSANLNYYLFNGNVDLRKGILRLMYICSCPGTERSSKYFITNVVFMCFTRNALSWGDSRNRCLMKSPNATGYSGLIWLI